MWDSVRGLFGVNWYNLMGLTFFKYFVCSIHLCKYYIKERPTCEIHWQASEIKLVCSVISVKCPQEKDMEVFREVSDCGRILAVCYGKQWSDAKGKIRMISTIKKEKKVIRSCSLPPPPQQWRQFPWILPEIIINCK